jgi:hypothetical protein
MLAGVTCTFNECYYTQLMGEEQGVAVFREVLVSDGCTAEIISEPTIKFDGEKYWQNGAIVKLTAPDDVAFRSFGTTAIPLRNPVMPARPCGSDLVTFPQQPPGFHRMITYPRRLTVNACDEHIFYHKSALYN